MLSKKIEKTAACPPLALFFRRASESSFFAFPSHFGLSILTHFHLFISIFDQFNQFFIFPILEVWVLLLQNIITKLMVQFGFPKHQRVYRGHKIPCEFRTQPQTTRNLAQLAQPTSNKKWKPLAPHQLLKKSKNVF